MFKRKHFFLSYKAANFDNFIHGFMFSKGSNMLNTLSLETVLQRYHQSDLSEYYHNPSKPSFE